MSLFRKRTCAARLVGCTRRAAWRDIFCRPHRDVAEAQTGFHIPEHVLRESPPEPRSRRPPPPPPAPAPTWEHVLR